MEKHVSYIKEIIYYLLHTRNIDDIFSKMRIPFMFSRKFFILDIHQ